MGSRAGDQRRCERGTTKNMAEEAEREDGGWSGDMTQAKFSGCEADTFEM